MATKGERHWSRKDKAKAILECVTLGDLATCKKYSITRRTLQRWHEQFKNGTDAELTRSVAEKKAVLDAAWASEIPKTLTSLLDHLFRAGKEASPTDPEAIHAVAGALKIVSEVDGTYKMIDARISGQDRKDRETAGSVPAGSNVTPIRKASG